MGTLAKHLLGLCFFFVLGLVIGAIPLGILCTPFIDSSHSKEAPVYGALIGGVCLVSAYVTIFLLGNSRGKNEPQANEVLVKQLLGLCFWAFAGFSGGAVLLAFLYTFVTDAYIEWQFEVGIVGGFVGAGCLSAGYIAYCRGVFSSSKKETARNYSMKQQN
jgi:hypothetical protein